jgi:hypothetical protein
MTVRETEAELDDPLLTVGQGPQDAVELVLEQDERRRLDGHDGVGVLDEVAEVGILLSDRRLQGHRFLGDALDLDDPFGGQAHLRADLLGRGFAAEILVELALHAHQLVDGLHHVDRDPDGPGLVGDRSRDRLADPPGRIGRELVALGVVEFLDGTYQPEIPLLDEIEEQHSATDVTLGDGDHQAQVGLDQSLLRPHSVAGEQFEVGPLSGGDDGRSGHLLLGEQSRLDRFREFDFLFCRE